jgi:hypothetical protein
LSLLPSGVPQGCPASPIIFLLIAEALSRAIISDTRLKGVTVDGVEYKITQFADDTQLILAGYKYMKRMWGVLSEYEDATGMLANKKKFEGIRLGALIRKLIPTVPELRTEMIKWVPKGGYVRVLGIPFFESYDMTLFYEKLYAKTKGLLATWKDHKSLAIVGQSMLANSMVYSRFRYFITVEPMPAEISQAIQKDVQALLWNKDTTFLASEVGSVLRNGRWMKQESQYLPRKGTLGAGVLHWEAHTEAIQVNKLIKYRDASLGMWKSLLDTWFDREASGRGAIFAAHRVRPHTVHT